MSADECLVWADGSLRGSEERVVRAADPGFLLGLAAFETLLWEDRVLYFVDEHLSRLEHSACGLGLEAPPWSPREALAEFVGQLTEAPKAVRLTLTPGAPGHGPSLVITGRAWVPPDPRGVGVRVQARAKLAGDPLEQLKTSSRARNALARAAAQEIGAWDTLFGTDEGDLTEGCVSNLFAVVQGRLLTPPVARGVLPGIVRDKLLEASPGELGVEVLEERLELADLERASEVFLTNSLARIAPVAWIHELREDLPGGGGPVAVSARRWIRGVEQRYRAQQAAGT